ncbi:MBL fold metallo-hydrolase [Hahella sp. KA22]|uniref:MBL fold metallo-hydrolase n=1 Tax=Hahella sp. KA22 TaxID=1628392 RepID=UPI000FDE45C8|nr:MBL fold metallo-hydrolase [Hahella sp. KA22]AZZ94071.1 MBL fold metallo-hydrolase [Hahella sp. KA22]QAY57445.1 MBL fold metallo-hydrolase [Hahella sp. KA22]
MSTGVKVRLFEAGHCVHPGFMVKPGLGLAPRKFPAGVAVVEHPQEGVLLFDTGYHQRFSQCTQHYPERFYALATPCSLQHGESLKEQLATQKILADQVRHVVLSHFHADHIAGVCDFEKATLHCHPAGHRFLTQTGRLRRLRKGYLRDLLPAQAEARLSFTESFPLDLADILEMPTQPLGLGARDLFGDQTLYLVALPGHAAGQMGLLVRLQDKFLFLLADACWLVDNLRDGVDQHWLANIICDDRKAYRDTLEKLRRCYRDMADKVIFAPSHCQDTLGALIQQGWLS